MARSKRDILDTEAMLTRLTNLLVEHAALANPLNQYPCARTDAESLRRISMTLRNWFEMECNGDIEQGEVSKKWYQAWSDSRGHRRQSDSPIADREAGARKRLAAILKRYPTLTAYVQTDPRGCALYILTPEQINGVRPDEIDAIYSRGLAVFK